MNNKDVQLNIKVDTSASQNNGFLNKLFIALSLSLSTTVSDSLEFSSSIITIALIVVMVVVAFVLNKK